MLIILQSPWRSLNILLNIGKKVVFVLNECANLEKLPFKVVKDFRIGSNCFIDNYDIIEDIKNIIKDIKRWLRKWK